MSPRAPDGRSAPFSDGVPPVVALVGEDEHGKEALLAAIVQRAGPEAATISWSGEGGDRPGVELARLLGDLRSRPLFGGRKLIVVRDGDGLQKRAGADLAKVLAADAGNHLILLCRALDGRTAFAKALQKSHALLRCDRPKAELSHFDMRRGGANELLAAVVREARARGLALSEAVASELAGRTGNDVMRIASELDKLALYLHRPDGAEVRVDARDVEDLVPRSAAYDQFKLFEEVATGQCALALARVRGMFREGTMDRRGRRMTDPRAIAAVLTSLLHMRLNLLARFRAHQERGLRGADLQQALGVRNPGQMYFLEKEASLPLVRESGRAVALLADADRELKSGEPADLTLEVLLVKLARLARAQAAGTAR